VEIYLHSPNTPSLRGAKLKHRDNITFTLPSLDRIWGRPVSYPMGTGGLTPG